jgi:hypothetical protein
LAQRQNIFHYGRVVAVQHLSQRPLVLSLRVPMFHRAASRLALISGPVVRWFVAGGIVHRRRIEHAGEAAAVSAAKLRARGRRFKI